MAVHRPAVDLSACDTEPIHIIGAIQPHGALLALEDDSLDIAYASMNARDHLGRPLDAILSGNLAGLVGDDNVEALRQRQLRPQIPDLLKPWFVRFGDAEGRPRALECFPHSHAGRTILEFVPFEDGPATIWEEDMLRQRIISELIKPDTLADLARTGAEIIRQVTGFDRVMIYRFAEDLHGEVIAESTSRADSFLGLHYPASDIPDPARRHFTLNVIRSIPDINAPASPIVNRAGEVADRLHGRPLDLTYSKLRAVAPVHIEYLNNMGVGASMSISLTSNDHLWGLVACHHYAPLHLPWSRFRFCELLGGTISALLQSLENATQLRQSINAERTAFAIEQEARSARALADIVTANQQALLHHAGAQGMLLRLGGRDWRLGGCPAVDLDYPAIAALARDGIAFVDNLPEVARLDPQFWDIASGAAMIELSEDGRDFLVFFREQYEHTIKWAGKPDKLAKTRADGTVRLSPRGSFALWREERRGRSRPFSTADREAMRILRRALLAINSLDRERAANAARKQAEEEEARLRLTLMEAARKSSLGELASALAHELNQPLAAVTNYVNACRQELRNYGQAVPEDVNRLIDKAVAESSRAANLVRRLRNFIAQGELVPERSDLRQILRQGTELALVASGHARPDIVFRIDDDVPQLLVDPVQLGQVVLNLVRNSLPAMRDSPVRRITISAVRSGDFVEVSVLDTGHGIAAELQDRLFEPFHSSTTSGMGIGLSLCRSIIEAHRGRIFMRPRSVGAEIVFTLPVGGFADERTR